MAQKATRGRARTPKAGAKRLHVAPIGFRTQCFWSAMSPRIAFLPCSEPQLDQADHRDLLPA